MHAILVDRSAVSRADGPAREPSRLRAMIGRAFKVSMLILHAKLLLIGLRTLSGCQIAPNFKLHFGLVHIKRNSYLILDEFKRFSK